MVLCLASITETPVVVLVIIVFSPSTLYSNSTGGRCLSHIGTEGQSVPFGTGKVPPIFQGDTSYTITF
jgi:hypothetical protein